MLGAELSVIESAAASPGVLVIPPAIVPIRSKRCILKTKCPNRTATIIGTIVMARPTPNNVHPLSWKVDTKLTPADVPTSARNSNSPIWRSNWLAEPDMDQMIGPVFPIALRISATIRMPPVNPGEKEKESEKDIFSFPNRTPRTIPAAIGKKSVSDSFFSSFPNTCPNSLMSSFSPATISLSPNFSNRSGSGERSIPLRRTRVTVQLNVRCRFR